MGCINETDINDIELKLKDYCPCVNNLELENSNLELTSHLKNSKNQDDKENDNKEKYTSLKQSQTQKRNEKVAIYNQSQIQDENDNFNLFNQSQTQNTLLKQSNNKNISKFENCSILKSEKKEIHTSIIKQPLFQSVLCLLPNIPNNKKGPFVEYINQTITITNYGQEIETELQIKIINLEDDEYSNSYTINFDTSSQIEDMDFDFDDGIKVISKSHQLTFQYKLYNNDQFRVKYKYKLIRNNICKYYRSEFIGIQKTFFGAVGKYIINIPKEYCVINTENEIFKTEILNEKYIWENIIPENGLNEFFKISYWDATWKCTIYQEFETEYENDYIRHVEIFTPKFYIDGNLNVKKYEIRCSLNEGIDNKIIQDLGNRYHFLMENVQSQNVFFQIISKFTIDINSPYKVNIKESDIPKLNNLDKEYFKEIALEIIKNDKSNKPNYFKIGKYIKNYLTYDITYSNKILSPREIYLNRKGVCSHYTILYNTLLNSIDIPSIYVSGIANDGKEKNNNINQINDENHAWTLAKINNKWIPLDCTWGLLNGILPVSHIFKYYNKSDIEYILGREKKLPLKEEIKYLEK